MENSINRVLLEGWEDVYKKSQLTLWVLLALKDSPKSMADIKNFIHDRTNQTITADDKSMYRALRRFAEADLISATSLPNPNGPDMKQWQLTNSGSWVLAQFISRNITDVLLHSRNQDLWK